MSKSRVQKYAPLIAAVGAAALGGIAGNYIFNNFEDDEKNAEGMYKKADFNSHEQTASEDINPKKEFESGEKTPRAPLTGFGKRDAEPTIVPTTPLPQIPPPSSGELTDENSVPSKLPKTPLPQVPPPSRDTEKNQLYVITPDGAIQPYLPLEENTSTDKEVRAGKALFIKRDSEK